jgi:hypothetical protein
MQLISQLRVAMATLWLDDQLFGHCLLHLIRSKRHHWMQIPMQMIVVHGEVLTLEDVSVVARVD